MSFQTTRVLFRKPFLLSILLLGSELCGQVSTIDKGQPASNSQAQKSPPATEAVRRGQKQFSTSCAFCHGAAANGGAEGPNLILSSLVRHDKGGDLIGPVIRQGRASKGMPAFSFSAEQIADIAAFLHERINLSDIRSATGKGNYSLKQLLTGNADAGKQFFYGNGGCNRCHAPDRDLAGIAKKYLPMELQAKILYPAGARSTVTVTDPSGAKVNGELLHKDLFTVALRDREGWYHSWPIHSVHVEVNDPLAAHRELLDKYSNADMHNLFAYLETLR